MLLFFQNVTQITSLFLNTLSEPMSEFLHDVAKHLQRNDCFLCQIYTFNFLPLFMAVAFSNNSTMVDEMLYKREKWSKSQYATEKPNTPLFSGSSLNTLHLR